jgi:hypothetical protein
LIGTETLQELAEKMADPPNEDPMFADSMLQAIYGLQYESPPKRPESERNRGHSIQSILLAKTTITQSDRARVRESIKNTTIECIAKAMILVNENSGTSQYVSLNDCAAQSD